MMSSPAASRLPLVACLLVLVLGAVVAGCGEQGKAAPESAGARAPAPRGPSGSEAKSGTAAAGCPQQLGAFIDALDALRTQLAVGLAYEQYAAKVKGLRASYVEIPVERLTIDCLARGIPSKRVLNEHIDAANAWAECLADAACTTAAIEPVLQRRWRVASRYLSEAQ